MRAGVDSASRRALRPRPLDGRRGPLHRVLLHGSYGCTRASPSRSRGGVTARRSRTCRAASPTVPPSEDELPGIDADVFVVELKAAAIDVVAEAALARDIEVVLAANDVVALAGESDLDECLLEMAKFQG